MVIYNNFYYLKNSKKRIYKRSIAFKFKGRKNKKNAMNSIFINNIKKNIFLFNYSFFKHIILKHNILLNNKCLSYFTHRGVIF